MMWWCRQANGKYGPERTVFEELPVKKLILVQIIDRNMAPKGYNFYNTTQEYTSADYSELQIMVTLHCSNAIVIITSWCFLYLHIVKRLSGNSQSQTGGDCPKTQKSILKVEDTTQDTTIEKQEMVSENDFVVHSDIKVENEDRSKLVFGQPGGGDCPKTRVVKKP